MLFPTLAFAVFFLIVYFATWALGAENRSRKIFLLLASWFFYAQWDERFVALLILSAVLNWGIAAMIARRAPDRRKWLLVLGVTVNLLILGTFKYYGFFVEQFANLLAPLGWGRDIQILQILLPVGISFFTFQGISYVVDVHRGKTPPAKSLLDVMLLMSFFPHLVAGPIVRASDLLPQFDKAPRLTREAATWGLLLIVWGLFKKSIIATEISVDLVDPVFFDPSAYSSVDIAFAVYGYAVQIYCDFSAYSDMAIGIAALLGYSLPAQLRPAVPGAVDAGLLAALAHQPVQLAARLSLHPAGRRQAAGCWATLPQRLPHHAAGRPVARRGLDLPGLGRAARLGAGGRASGAICAGRSQGHADGHRRDRHLPHRLPGLDPVPRREFRHGRGDASGPRPTRSGAGPDATAARAGRRRPGHALAAAARHRGRRRCGSRRLRP